MICEVLTGSASKLAKLHWEIGLTQLNCGLNDVTFYVIAILEASLMAQSLFARAKSVNSFGSGISIRLQMVLRYRPQLP